MRPIRLFTLPRRAEFFAAASPTSCQLVTIGSSRKMSAGTRITGNAAMASRGPTQQRSHSMSGKSRKLRSLRRSAFEQQGGCCYYCKRPMWLTEPERHAAAHGLTRKQARALQCTAEHLLPRKDGGTNDPVNIVAACLFCNHRRHARPRPLSPERYSGFVQRRLRTGRWQVWAVPGQEANSVCNRVAIP